MKTSLVCSRFGLFRVAFAVGLLCAPFSFNCLRAESAPDACALPFVREAGALTEGALAGQLPAAQVPAICASIVEIDGGEERVKALAIAPSNPAGEVLFRLSAPADFGAILWFETTAKVAATNTRTQFVDLDGMLVALVKDAAGGVHLEAYDGRQGLANGGGRWTKLRIKNYDLRSDDFFTLTVRADYLRKKFDVFLNGKLAAVNLGFDESAITAPTVLALYGHTAGEHYFQKIYLSNVPPATLPVSTAGDGIADAWKTQNGLSLSDATLRDADADGNGLTLLEEYFYGLAPGAPVGAVLGREEIVGGFYCEVWKNISGGAVSRLVAETGDFRKRPDAVSLTKGAEAPADFSDNYGRRVRGFVTIPAAGTYTFYLTGDDTAELFISPDGTKWNKVTAASVPSYVGADTWTQFSSQKSAAYTLPAGRRLFVEIRHKEGGGGDHLRLGWTVANAEKLSVPEPSLVPAEAISSFVFEANDQDDDDLPDDWERNYNLDTADNGLKNPANGKHGHNNAAGLDNHQCLKLGLDPRNPDIAGIVGKQSVTGVLQREVWTEIAGTDANDLLADSKFAQTPERKAFTPPDGFINDGDNYGARWRGWLTAPVSGRYRLRISADDYAQLWLSTDETVANKRRICRVNGYVGRYADSSPKQTSVPAELVAGRKYYLEILHKEGGGDDHCEIAWSTPEDPGAFVPVPPDCVASWVDDASLTQIGYAKTWLEKYNLSQETLLPDAFCLPASYLPNWEAYRVGTDPRATLEAFRVGTDWPTLEDLRASAETGQASGFWIREIWEHDLPGEDIAANAALFATAPTRRQVVKGGDDFETQIIDRHIDRTRGYLTVPETGLYQLALSSDDAGEVYLSADSTPKRAKLVAQVKGYTAWDDFFAQATQLSAPQFLETGRKYYLEIRHCETGGNDLVQLTWATPSNPQELVFVPASAMAVYVPPANDPNGWGYPTDWLADTGLDQLPPEQQTPWADADGDGLTNLEEYKSGLNPRLNDTDGDGVSDFEELKLAHTNPLEKDFNGTVVTVAEIPGAAFNQGGATVPVAQRTTGNWQIIGSSVYSADVRGTLAYTVIIPSDAQTLSPSAPLRLVIHGGQYIPDSTDKILETDVYVDAAYAGRAVLDLTKQPLDAQTLSPLDAVAQATLWLPVLPAGTHTLKLAWLNGKSGTSLRVDKLQLQQLGGTWLAARQNALSALDETPALSYTSPYCLEGGAQDAGKLTVMSNYIPDTSATDAYSIFVREKFFTNEAEGSGQTGEGNSSGSLKANAALRGKYYSDIPLSPAGNADGSSATNITVFDAATGATRAKQITWLPYDLALHAGEALTLRAGDALLLKSENEIRVTGPSDAQTLSPSAASPFVFKEPGNYKISDSAGTVTVRAVSANLLPAPTCLLNGKRTWTPTLLTEDAWLDYDDGLRVSDRAVSASGSRILDLTSLTGGAATVLARLGQGGPIMSATAVNTITSYGNPTTKWDVVTKYPDGSEVWRGQISLGGVIPDDFYIVLTPYKAGVTFGDGSIRLVVTAADFDENGVYTYYVHKAQSTNGAPCHEIRAYGGDVLLSTYSL